MANHAIFQKILLGIPKFSTHVHESLKKYKSEVRMKKRTASSIKIGQTNQILLSIKAPPDLLWDSYMKESTIKNAGSRLFF